MNSRERQLQERDVRKESPEQSPVDFMRRYLASNFPQTMAMPSMEQKQNPMPISNLVENTLNLKQKPLSGTKYDDPGVS